LRLLPVCAAVRAVIVHVVPSGQVAVISVSALSGVGPSATVELPPPTFKPPQPSDLRIVPSVPPERTVPQLPLGGPVTNLRARGTVVLVEDVVLEDVEVVLLVLVLEDVVVLVLVVLLEDVVVLDDVVLLVEVVLLVLVLVLLVLEDVVVLLLVVDDVVLLVEVVLLVLVDVVVVLDVLVLLDVVLLLDVLVLLDVVVLVEVVPGPLAQSMSEPATAPVAMN